MTIEEFKELQEKSSIVQRNWIVQNQGVIIIKYTQTEKSYYVTQYRPTYSKTGDKLFLREVKWEGFKIGKNIKETWIKDFNIDVSFIKANSKYYGFDWLDLSLFENNYRKLTPAIWKRILCKKFTNNTQILDYLATYSYKLNSKDKGLKRQAVKTLIKYGLGIPYLNITVDVINLAFFRKDFTDIDGLLRDISTECFILGKKFDPNWSLSRLKQFHQDNIKELSMAEFTDIEDITYDIDINLPEEYTLLKTPREVFVEAKMMNHCIFNNYSRFIKEGKYIALRCDKYNATVGITRMWSDKWKIDQIQGVNNSYILERDIIIEELESTLAELNSKNKITILEKITQDVDYELAF